MEGVWVVDRQNADIADTLHLRDVAMATTFWLSVGYNFGCMIANDTLFDTIGVGFRSQAVQWRHSRFRGSKGRCYGNHVLTFYIRGALWCDWAVHMRRWCGLMSNYFDHLFIFRPHRSTTYVDADYCYQPSSMVCLSVCHTSEPCKNGWTDWDAIWVEDSSGPREPCIRWRSRSSHGKGQFVGGKGRPIVKYRDARRLSVQKWLNRSRCHLGCGLGWAQGIVLDQGPQVLRDVVMATIFGFWWAIILLVW